MSRFDEDTSTMRMRLAAAPIELRNPEHEPPPRARGIAVGVLLGAAIWAAIVALGVAIWRWIIG
jgi:fatty acid desaturase